ncbi:MAG: acyl-CoA dehydrogenase family protein, partial [Alphaproteobacteria bacterium]|nr:acyl-CoA dehydrogenase family protein [Alphaproteobacteria bacterium]
MTDDRRALLAETGRALGAAEAFLAAAQTAIGAETVPLDALDSARVEARQFAAHALAWIAATVEGLRQIRDWALRLDGAGELGESETLILATAYGEYLAQLTGGVPMAQSEFARPSELGLGENDTAELRGGAAAALAAGLPAARSRLGSLIAADGEAAFGRIGLDDAALVMMREEVRRFAQRAVAPLAQEWHRRDELIPLPLIEELAAIGAFGVTIPEEHGGLGLGKTAMCIVSEELSRAYLGVGSLGTRAEIAGELIRQGGTDAQKRRWLPAIAAGEVLPTAVFTEPGAGSDLAAVATRAVRDGDVFRIYGAKTWITHGARSDLMTLLARTNAQERGYRGLSMFLAPKPRGSDADPFPAEGMSGTEIPVLGYRGMKEYEIAFDGFAVPADALLGAVEGEGFKQLMATFESARIQTAARAIGVAQNALELGLAYARERRQFGKPLAAFPRISERLALMATETMTARQLT